ncbi:MAG TPA: VOC family protein [Candidatus Polarisedimenticolaceae bacterium]|nr:VOC family protein [Candidatus Polarisedimenticolaceae bacterium]
MPRPASRPVPEGMNTLTAHLWFSGNCRQAVDFYQRAFGAEPAGPVASGPDGKSVMHAMLKLGNSHIMLADAWPGQWEQAPQTGSTAGLFVYVEDCDKLFARAVQAGCETILPMADMFWGDRMGKLKDPYGHCWGIATHKWEMTPEEVKRGQEEWLKSAKR